MSQKKKVLFLQVSMLLGGVETVLVNYLNILAKNGNFDIDLAIFEGGEKHNIEKIDSSVGIEFLLNEIETQFSRYSYWKSQEPNISDGDRNYYSSWAGHINNVRLDRLINKIDTKQYDLIIDFQGTAITFFSPEYIRKIKQPLISWIHSDSDFERWVANQGENREKLLNIDAFVSICDDMKKKCDDILNNTFDLYGNKSYMLYNPLDRQKVIELSNQEVSDSDKELLNQPFILQVARLDERQKNHLKMIEIFSRLKQKGIRERLYIVGQGGSQSILEEKIKELGLENDCLLLGARTNPLPFMKHAKLFIHTANYEGLPTVLIESMICNVPVVAFDCPTGPREILADGKYGELIPMGNDELFIDRVYELLNNEPKRQDYISLLPEATEKFGYEEITKKLISLIDDSQGFRAI